MEQFFVGERVKVRIAKDVIPEQEIMCDTGFVRSVHLQFEGTEKERIIYRIRLDGIYAKKIYKRYRSGYNYRGWVEYQE